MWGGAAEGTRTPDPIITNDVLYQLSYCGHRQSVRTLATVSGGVNLVGSDIVGSGRRTGRRDG